MQHLRGGSSPPSDTSNPHERPFTGMLDRHPRPASGRGGCFSSLFRLGGPPLPGPVLVVFGDDDRWRVAATGTHGLLIRVIGQDRACCAQLVDQVCGAGRAGQLSLAPVARFGFAAVACEEDGDGGQVRQDLVPRARRCSWAGRDRGRWRWSSRPAPVRGPAVGPAAGFQPPPAPAARDEPGQQVPDAAGPAGPRGAVASCPAR